MIMYIADRVDEFDSAESHKNDSFCCLQRKGSQIIQVATKTQHHVLFNTTLSYHLGQYTIVLNIEVLFLVF